MIRLLLVLSAFFLTIPAVYCIWWLACSWIVTIYNFELTMLSSFYSWDDEHKVAFMAWAGALNFIALAAALLCPLDSRSS